MPSPSETNGPEALPMHPGFPRDAEYFGYVKAEPESTQTTLTFVGEHEGITVAFIGLLILLVIYLYKESKAVKKDKSNVVIAGLQQALDTQRSTLDNTLDKLNSTVSKLEKTITDLAAELFRDMHSLDRRLSKLEGEHNASVRLHRRSTDHGEDCECTDCEGASKC